MFLPLHKKRKNFKTAWQRESANWWRVGERVGKMDGGGRSIHIDAPKRWSDASENAGAGHKLVSGDLIV